MSRNPQVLATKKDITMLMDTIGKYYDKTVRLVGEHKEEIKEHFDVVAENIKHDFKGAFKDKLEQHEDRITRLEERVGVGA